MSTCGLCDLMPAHRRSYFKGAQQARRLGMLAGKIEVSMSYNPHNYVIDGRRMGAGYALAAVALMYSFAVSCPSTSAKTDVVAEAHNMQYIGAFCA